MVTFYNLNAIPKILDLFNVNNIVILGSLDEKLLKFITNYNSNVMAINLDVVSGIETTQDIPVNALPRFNGYDAIFINDDSNYFTVFSELNIIKNSNDEFPLVFICNNKFPNKRRDSYVSPDNIPIDFINVYSDELILYYDNDEIVIHDGNYHACDEKTPKNGVLTAIEDFLVENNEISIMKINFIDEITILFSKLQINHYVITNIIRCLEEYKINSIELIEGLNENRIIYEYIKENNDYLVENSNLRKKLSKNEEALEKYENELKITKDELIHKDYEIRGIESKLNLKDSQIQNISSKLVYRETKLNAFRDQLRDKDVNLNSLNQNIKNFKNDEIKYKKQISSFKEREEEFNKQISSFKEREEEFNKQISSFKEREEGFNKQISSFKEREEGFNKQISSLKESEIVLNNQIKDNVDYLKYKDSIIQQKNNQINIKQIELNDKEKLLDMMKKKYGLQLSKLDNKEYCIGCFKEEISNNKVEINYLKNNAFYKKILTPFSYLYLILKSNPREINLNLKLYRALKNSKCFDIGFYLNNNKDLQGSYWCKYFSPELHYICNGFNEKRKFNKKYFNRNSKKELLDYIKTCEKKLY